MTKVDWDLVDRRSLGSDARIPARALGHEHAQQCMTDTDGS